MGPCVRIGLERLLEEETRLIAGRRVGLLCHGASVDPTLAHACDRVKQAAAPVGGLQSRGLQLLLGPEHGLWGAAQDMEPVDGKVDPRFGIPVVSLYGDDEQSLVPARQALASLDVLVVDLQDVGARYYTYIWTMLRCLEVAADVSIEVVVCDRPNPLGGRIVEGERLRPGFESFVGGHDMAVRHGMTIGELARLFVCERKLDVDLEVMPLAGWNRTMEFADTGLPWVLPSPNMPTLDTARVYPGMCLVEATELSEARGTTKPFELVGADFVDGAALASLLDTLELPGVRFRPTYFKPTSNKMADRVCGGVQLHVCEPDVYQAYRTGVAVLWAVRKLWPHAFALRQRPYEFVDDIPALDLLSGSDRLRGFIERDLRPPEMFAAWRAEEQAFRRRREAHLLYD